MGPVWEDENELGYWAGCGSDLSKQPPSSQIVCNKIIPKDEQECITLAAFCAHEGYHGAAELARRDAYYDRLGSL